MERKLNDNDFIVSKTDLKGRITYCNKIFMDLAGYSEEELLGAAHNIIRHEKMPKAVFKLLWDRIAKKEEIFAFVINESKNRDFYWVFANVTASLDVDGKIIGYHSVRRKPNPKAVAIIEPLYAQMLEVEKAQGMEASAQVLFDLLEEKGLSYDELIAAIQE